MVNRVTGKMQQIPLPEFDPYSSAAAWFRDYAAYCGDSDDGKKISAIIVQWGRRKPLLKRPVADISVEMPDSECPDPVWERAPSRVMFEPKGQPKFTFTVPTQAVDIGTEKKRTRTIQKRKTNRKNHYPGGVSAACNNERLTK